MEPWRSDRQKWLSDRHLGLLTHVIEINQQLKGKQWLMMGEENINRILTQ